jgi:hypothetical protein
VQRCNGIIFTGSHGLIELKRKNAAITRNIRELQRFYVHQATHREWPA